MNIENLYQIFLKSKGVCTDTRNITPGCLYFALKGENFNGNAFAEEALQKGAYKAVIDEKAYQHENTLLCDNVLETLQQLATFHRRYLNLPIIALTGSNGKTTTKELINAVLSKKYKTTATKGNLNNHIGVPLTLLSMTSETEIGIVEMGANHIHEIERLSEIALPDYGYITNFGKAHLEGFGSVEGVIIGKTELYKNLKKHQKKVFVNISDPLQVTHALGIEQVHFGEEGKETSISVKTASPYLILHFKGIDIKSNLTGLYNYPNIAAAIAMGDYFNVSKEQIKKAIEGYTPANNRSQLLKKNTNKILLDAYNANPTSMWAALDNFKQLESDQKVLFLGDMFELGADAEKEHQAITSYLDKHFFEKVFLVGSNFYNTTAKEAHIQKFKNFDTLKEHLEKETETINNSFILIKGSRGMALERILPLL